jgi:hypothetical protein
MRWKPDLVRPERTLLIKHLHPEGGSKTSYRCLGLISEIAPVETEKTLVLCLQEGF